MTSELCIDKYLGQGWAGWGKPLKNPCRVSCHLLSCEPPGVLSVFSAWEEGLLRGGCVAVGTGTGKRNQELHPQALVDPLLKDKTVPL